MTPRPPTDGPVSNIGKPKKALMIIATPKDDGPPPLKSPAEPDGDEHMEPDEDDIPGSSEGQSCATCWAFNGVDTCMHFPQYASRKPTDWCAQYKAGKPHKSGPTGEEPGTDDTGSEPEVGAKESTPGIGGY